MIVRKLEKSLEPSAFAVTPFEKPKAGERMLFEVNVVAEAEERMAKRARVEPNLPSWGCFEIRCDEGGALGGDDTAPPPLGYLSAGLAFCLLTHLSSFIRARKLRIDDIRVEQRVRFSTSLVTEAENDADLQGACDGVETHVIVKSDEPREKLEELLEVSERACMAMQAFVNATPQQTRLHLNVATSAP